VTYATRVPKEVITVGAEHQQWSGGTAARQEHDLEEIRRLFARYRRLAAETGGNDEPTSERDVPREPEPKRVPAGVGA
jgi:hypothetical protein